MQIPKRRALYFSILLFFELFVTCSNSFSQQTTNRAFTVGEKLVFSIGWEFINAGTAELTVEGMETVRNKPCYHITAITNSNTFFSTLYKVRDRLETFIDAETLYPLRYIKHQHEGGYKRNFEVDFNQKESKATIADADSGKTEINVPSALHDIISAFYFVRAQPLTIGQHFELNTFDNGKVKVSAVKVIKKEKISVAAGDFDCILVQTPIGPFNNKTDLNIWLTDDNRKMPVLVKSKIIIGSIKVELRTYEGAL
jgi:hypothetical protein